MAVVEPITRRWTRDEYYRMGEMGMFEGQRVELIGGEIVVMSPQNPPHFAEIKRVETQLTFVFGHGYWIRVQGPLSLGLDSDPEPDLAVVKGSVDDFSNEHPSSALLIVEVSDTTVEFDRGRKASLYACAGIADYWIVNLRESQLEVYRNPMRDRDQPFAFRYSSATILKPGRKIAPLAKPKSVLSVGKLLPR